MHLRDKAIQTGRYNYQEGIAFVRTFPDPVTVSPERVTVIAKWIHVVRPPHGPHTQVTRVKFLLAKLSWR